MDYQREEMKRRWVEELCALTLKQPAEFMQFVEKSEQSIFQKSRDVNEYRLNVKLKLEAQRESVKNSSLQRQQQQQQRQQGQQGQGGHSTVALASQAAPRLPPQQQPNMAQQQQQQQQNHHMFHQGAQLPAYHSKPQQQQDPRMMSNPQAQQQQQHVQQQQPYKAPQQPPQVHKNEGFEDFLSTFLEEPPQQGQHQQPQHQHWPAGSNFGGTQQPPYSNINNSMNTMPPSGMIPTPGISTANNLRPPVSAQHGGGGGMQQQQQQQQKEPYNGANQVASRLAAPGNMPARVQQHAAMASGQANRMQVAVPQQSAGAMGSYGAALQAPSGGVLPGQQAGAPGAANGLPRAANGLPRAANGQHPTEAECTEIYWKIHNELRQTGVPLLVTYVKKMEASLPRVDAANMPKTQRKIEQLREVVSKLSIQRGDLEAATRLDTGIQGIKLLQGWKSSVFPSKNHPDAQKALMAQQIQAKQQLQAKQQQMQQQQQTPGQQLPIPHSGAGMPVALGPYNSMGQQQGVGQFNNAPVYNSIPPISRNMPGTANGEQPPLSVHPMHAAAAAAAAAHAPTATAPSPSVAPSHPQHGSALHGVAGAAKGPTDPHAPHGHHHHHHHHHNHQSQHQPGQQARRSSTPLPPGSTPPGSTPPLAGHSAAPTSALMPLTTAPAAVGKLPPGAGDPLARVLRLLKNVDGEQQTRPSSPSSAPGPNISGPPGMKPLQLWSRAIDDCDIPSIPAFLLPDRALSKDPHAPSPIPLLVSRCSTVCHMVGTEGDVASAATFPEPGASMASTCTADLKAGGGRMVEGSQLDDDASSRERFKRRRDALEGHCMDLQSQLSPGILLTLLSDSQPGSSQQAMIAECVACGKSATAAASLPGLCKLDEQGAWKRLKIQVPMGYKIPIDFASAAMLADDDEAGDEDACNTDAALMEACLSVHGSSALSRLPFAVFPSSDPTYDTPLGATVRTSFQAALAQYEPPSDSRVQLRALVCLWRDTVMRLEDEVLAAAEQSRAA